MVLGGVIAICGFSLFVFNRGTTTDVVIDAAVSMVGAVAVIIPIVNMISVSLPGDTVATGLGLNTMLRNIGGAVGPVVATTIMSTYTANVPVPPGTPLPPSSTAFDYIFYLGIVAMFAIVIFSLAAKNYVFTKNSRDVPPQ